MLLCCNVNRASGGLLHKAYPKAQISNGRTCKTHMSPQGLAFGVTENLQIISTPSPRSKDLLVDVRSRSSLLKARIGSAGCEVEKHPNIRVWR